MLAEMARAEHRRPLEAAGVARADLLPMGWMAPGKQAEVMLDSAQAQTEGIPIKTEMAHRRRLILRTLSNPAEAEAVAEKTPPRRGLRGAAQAERVI